MLEVTRLRQDAQLAGIAGVPRGRCVARRDAHRDGVVAVAVQEELRDAEREALPRRCEDVPLVVRRGIAEERPRRGRRGHEPGGECEVEHAGLGDSRGFRDAWCAARCVGREGGARRGPESQVPSGRVADGDHA